MATLNTANDTFDTEESIELLSKTFAQMIMDGQCSAIVEYVNNCDTLNSDIDFFEYWNDTRGVNYSELVALGDNETRRSFAKELATDYATHILEI